jgi:hypothetical protein
MTGTAWETLCRCGHTMGRHRLDWSVDMAEPDCGDCACADFEMPAAVSSGKSGLDGTGSA